MDLKPGDKIEIIGNTTFKGRTAIIEAVNHNKIIAKWGHIRVELRPDQVKKLETAHP